MKRSYVVLACTCGTYWTAAAVEEFSAGDVGIAYDRHLALHRFDNYPHTSIHPDPERRSRPPREE